MHQGDKTSFQRYGHLTFQKNYLFGQWLFTVTIFIALISMHNLERVDCPFCSIQFNKKIHQNCEL